MEDRHSLFLSFSFSPSLLLLFGIVSVGLIEGGKQEGARSGKTWKTGETWKNNLLRPRGMEFGKELVWGCVEEGCIHLSEESMSYTGHGSSTSAQITTVLVKHRNRYVCRKHSETTQFKGVVHPKLVRNSLNSVIIYSCYPNLYDFHAAFQKQMWPGGFQPPK